MTAESNVVLLIDDDRDVRDFVALELESTMSVVTAEDGARGLELFKTVRPQVVLLDILMPDMDGFQVLEQLRKLERGKETPVIFLTALADRGTARRAAEAGVDDLLNKPVDPSELRTRTKMAVSLARARTEINSCHRVMRTQLDEIGEARNRRKLIASLLVHDMKNPLTVLKSDLESALADRALRPETREALLDAAEAGERLLSMVLNLLDIEVADEGKLTARVAPLDLLQLLQEVLHALGHAAAIRSVKLRLETRLSAAPVQADRDLGRRMFANLLDNAINNSKPNTEVKVVLEQVDGEFVARVVDEGPGIPDESKEAVFDRFVRLSDSARKNNYGLGLTSCKLAAETQGASIWVTDNQPRGASFNVKFPRSS